MGLRITFKQALSLQGALYVFDRNFPFFHEAMSENSRHSSMKEIEHPVVHPLAAYTQLVNAIPQQIRFRPPQFMP